jgi:prolyl oligopeptidase
MLDVKTGKQLGPIVERAQFGGISWSRDGRNVYFHRMQALKKGAPPTDKYQRSTACVMPAGGRESSIKVLLRAGDKGGVEIPATEFPFIEILPDGRAIATVFDGVSPEFAAWHSTEAALKAGRPAWKRLFTKADAITSMAVMGDRLLATTHRGATSSSAGRSPASKRPPRPRWWPRAAVCWAPWPPPPTRCTSTCATATSRSCSSWRPRQARSRRK